LHYFNRLEEAGEKKKYGDPVETGVGDLLDPNIGPAALEEHFPKKRLRGQLDETRKYKND